jgi:hypothetical protein
MSFRKSKQQGVVLHKLSNFTWVDETLPTRLLVASHCASDWMASIGLGIVHEDHMAEVMLLLKGCAPRANEDAKSGDNAVEVA